MSQPSPLLANLQPQPLWSFFAQICAIPHPSYHEQQLRQWILDWAQQRGLATEVDDVGNLIIRKSATPGYANREPVIIQAHLDMVPQANSDTAHDFTRDPIVPRIDGDWLTATGTTLGADNGIGMAAALAVLASDDIAHGPLEVLLTTNEEAGMDGAFGLKPGLLQGTILLNTDSEEDGEVYMGCAGGIDAHLRLPLSRLAPQAEGVTLRVALSGLRGGHSGCDIHRYRGNAIKLLGRLLQAAGAEVGLQLADLRGGSLRNAIPREASAVVVVAAGQEEALTAALHRYFTQMADELKLADPNFKLAISPLDQRPRPLTRDSQQRLLALIRSLPNGVVRMSDAMSGVVETSTNLGVMQLGEDQADLLCLIRSLRDSGKQDVVEQMQAVAALAGASIEVGGSYPGWEPDTRSTAMQLVRDSHEQLFGTIPNIMVIHAGLECGLFKAAYPHWDMVSFGPTIRFPHSPDERVDIASVGRFWQLLVEVLKRVPERS